MYVCVKESVCWDSLLAEIIQHSHRFLKHIIWSISKSWFCNILYPFLWLIEIKLNWFFQHLSRLEEAQNQCQTLHADTETLRLKLGDRDKMIDILRLQMENSIQMTVQHSHTADSLHQENNLLSNQLNQHKLEIQQLRVRRKEGSFILKCD